MPPSRSDFGVTFDAAAVSQSACNRLRYFAVRSDTASIAFAAFFSSFSTSSRSTNVRRISSASAEFLWRKFAPFSSHPLENWFENFEVSRQPMPGGSQNPDAVLLTPSPFSVKLTKLAFFPRHDHSDRTATFLNIADKLPDVAFGDGRLVLVVHENARLQRSTARIAERQDVVAVRGPTSH